MSGPLIFVTTARIKEGKLENFKRFTKELLENVKAKEPQLISFNIFLNEDGTEMTSVQIHPDAASIDFHMKVLGQVLEEDMGEWIERADFLEIKHIEICGTPSAGLLEADQPFVDSGAFSRSVKPLHVAGFTRATTG
jgi:quinol monooxygenase YgiN